jgi:hypothetical protein
MIVIPDESAYRGRDPVSKNLKLWIPDIHLRRIPE